MKTGAETVQEWKGFVFLLTWGIALMDGGICVRRSL